MSFDPTLVAEITAALSLTGAGLWKAYKWSVERKDRKKAQEQAKQIPKLLAGYVEIEDLLDSLRERTGAAKTLLLRLEDSGSVPEQGQDLFSSVYATSRDGSPNPSNPGFEVGEQIRRRWRNQLIDSAYHELIQCVFKDKVVKTTLEPNHPDRDVFVVQGMLSDLYRSEGIDGSVVCEVFARPARYFYLSVVWRKEEVPALDHALRDTLRQYVSDLGAVFRRNQIL